MKTEYRVRTYCYKLPDSTNIWINQRMHSELQSGRHVKLKNKNILLNRKWWTGDFKLVKMKLDKA